MCTRRGSTDQAHGRTQGTFRDLSVGRSSSIAKVTQVILRSVRSDAGGAVVGSAMANFDIFGPPASYPPEPSSRTGLARRARVSIIFNDATEELIEQSSPGAFTWLSSMNGAFFQLLICGLLILVGCYNTVFQKIQSRRFFDPAAINIWISFVSLLISVGVALKHGEIEVMFREGWLKKVAVFAIPGCGFALTSYLGILAVVFLSADTAKVLEQTCLMVLAVMAKLWFKRGQSMAGWTLLCVVTLCSCAYASTKQLEEDLAAVKAGATASQAQKEGGAMMTVGIVLCLSNVIFQSGVSILCEGLLKAERDTPFYIQKFYMEISGFLFSFLLVGLVNPGMVKMLEAIGESAGIQKQVAFSTKGMKGSWFKDPLAGMGDPFWWVTFLLMIAKSWLSGCVVKLLSSIAKQLCQVISVGITYFMSLIHLSCPDKTDYFCLGNIRSATFAMICCDLCIILSVIGYALAVNDAAKLADNEQKARELAQRFLPSQIEGGRLPDIRE